MQGGGKTPVYESLRSDDIFKLVGDFVTKPAELGIKGVLGFAQGALIILVGLMLDVVFAFATYWLGHQFALRVWRIRALKNSPAG